MLPAQYLTSHNDTPVIKISARWLREAGFEIGTGVTVKISERCLILPADNNEVQELREELYQVKQVVKGMRNGMFSVLNESWIIKKPGRFYYSRLYLINNSEIIFL
ncbi:type I addiction module toxin, SymE family [Escherichia marmotae]|nr:type I addiction module toxin, SymE family [Escherichia marmotae]